MLVPAAWTSSCSYCCNKPIPHHVQQSNRALSGEHHPNSITWLHKDQCQMNLNPSYTTWTAMDALRTNKKSCNEAVLSLLKKLEKKKYKRARQWFSGQNGSTEISLATLWNYRPFRLHFGTVANSKEHRNFIRRDGIYAIICYTTRMKKMLKEDEKMAMSYCVYGCKDHDLFGFYCLALVHIQGCTCHWKEFESSTCNWKSFVQP